MPDINRNPEAEGVEVVVVGSFNPAIFHPEWFVRQGLILEQDALESSMRAVSPQVTEIHICGLKLVCVQDRFFLGTSNVSHAARLQDMLGQIFKLLSHVPVVACGINASAEYAVQDLDHWHKIGHTLAPKDLIWNTLLDKPGMQELVIRGVRPGAFPGEINIHIGPSAVVTQGIMIRSNYHFQLPPEKVHSGATEVLLTFLGTEWDSACAMPRRVAQTIFEKIKPQND